MSLFHTPFVCESALYIPLPQCLLTISGTRKTGGKRKLGPLVIKKEKANAETNSHGDGEETLLRRD